MANEIVDAFLILLIMLFVLAIGTPTHSTHTTNAVIQNKSQSSHHQWKNVADYADHLAVKARNADQYFQ